MFLEIRTVLFIEMAKKIKFKLFGSIRSTSVSFGPFCPFWFYSVHLGPIWIYSVYLIHFGSIWSIRSYLIYFGPICSTSFLFGPFFHFDPIRSIQSTLVIFSPSLSSYSVQFGLFYPLWFTSVQFQFYPTRWNWFICSNSVQWNLGWEHLF